MLNFVRLLSGIVFTMVVQASVINLGIVSFDPLIGGSNGLPGVSAFNIANFTGDPGAGGFALPPDFPAFTPLTFQDSQLLVTMGASIQPIKLGDIPPGPLSTMQALEFPDTAAFTLATFSATLDKTQIELADGTTFVASPLVTAVIVASNGSTLAAGSDFGIITAVSASVSVPESPTFVLLGFAFIALFGGCQWCWLRFKS